MNHPEPPWAGPALEAVAAKFGVPAAEIEECLRIRAGGSSAMERTLLEADATRLDDLRGRPLAEVLASRNVLPLDLARALEDALFPSRPAAGGETQDPILLGPVSPSAGEAPQVAAAKIGRYTLRRELGRGGMGIVYLAHDPELKRDVALKVLPAGTAHRDQIVRFRREAEAAAKLSHPRIVSTYDVGFADGRHYITMELVNGGSLAQRIRERGRLAPREALEVMREVARGLAAAHALGIVHRDMKPENVLLEGEGLDRPKIADFGLARVVEEGGDGPRLTATQAVMGTASYMAPEQAAGETDRIDAQSDVYALGSMLYEALIGHPPYGGRSSMEVILQKLVREPDPPRKKLPALARDVETIVLKAMEREKERRYAGALAFADDIDRYLAGEMILARPVSAAYRGWRAISRHRGMVLASIAAAVAIAFTGALPTIREALAARSAARERVAREGESAGLLARARAALERREPGEAAAAARALVERFEADAARGERHPLPAAHEVLAQVHALKNEPRAALVERFRAYRAAIGADDAGDYLLAAGRELTLQSRFDLAISLLSRVLAQGGPATADARYWTGRAREGKFEFAAAAADLAHAAADPSLSPELTADAAAHRDFCARFARTLPLAFRARHLQAVDLDGDGRAELLGRFDDEVFTGVLRGGEWVETLRFRLQSGTLTAREVTAVAVVGLAGDRRSMLVHSAGDAEQRRGRIWLHRFEAEGPREVATAELEAPAQAFAAADLDGDGRAELLVGTGDYERSIRAYRWNESAGTLSLIGRSGAGGNVRGLVAADFDGERGDEVAVVAGPWGAYGVSLWRWDPERRALERTQAVGLGEPFSHCRLERAGEPPDVVVGVDWTVPHLDPLRARLGMDAIRKNFRPSGVYRVRIPRGRPIEVLPLAADAWEDSASGEAPAWAVARIRAPAGDLLLCKRRPLDRGGGEGSPNVHVIPAEGAAQPFLTARCEEPWTTMDPRQQPVLGFDADGDGSDELLLGNPASHSWTLRAAVSVDALLAAGAGPPAPTTAAASAQLEEDPHLEHADDLFRAELPEEALGVFRSARAKEVLSVADATRAAVGVVDALARLGRPEEMAAAAEEEAARDERVGRAALATALMHLEEAGRWREAVRVSACLLQCATLPPRERKARSARHEELQSLAEWRVGTGLAGAHAPAADWVATSPLFARREADGSWAIRVDSPNRGDVLAAPFANVGASWRVAATLSVRRQDWGTGIDLWVKDADPVHLGSAPARSLQVNCSGESSLPTRWLCLRSPSAARELWSGSAAWGDPLALSLTFVAHRGTLEGEAREPGPSPTAYAANISSRIPEGGTVWVGLSAHADVGSTGQSGRFAIPEWRFESAAEGVVPVAIAPQTAAEHLMLANGRFLGGRLADAKALYDRAVVLADLEADKEEAARACGLPSVWDRPVAGDIVRWAAVDARLYRGLVRAHLGDADGAQADLRAAWERSTDRVRALLRRYGAGLRDRPGDGATLARFWRERAGDPEGETRRAWARETAGDLGVACAEALIEGVAFVPLPRVRILRLADDGAGAVAGLRVGDFVLACEGARIERVADLRAAMERARAAGRKNVVLTLRRDAREFPAEVPVGPLGIAAEEIEEIRARMEGEDD